MFASQLYTRINNDRDIKTCFCVVEFPEEGTVAVVPQCWISGGNCYWPPQETHFTQSQIDRAVMSEERCNKRTWKRYQARILESYGTYSLAKTHLPQAEVGSDLTDGEVIVGRKRRIKKPDPYEADSSDSDDFPTPPSKRLATERPTSPELPSPPSPSVRTVEEINVNPPATLITLGDPPGPEESHTYFLPNTSTATGSGHSGNLAEFLVKSLTRIDARLVKIESKLESICNQDTEESFEPEDFKLPEMPITTEAELKRLDVSLQDDPSLVKKLIKTFSRIGGKTLNERVGLIIDRILSLELSVLYSFKGQRDKENFSRLKVCEIIKGAVMMKLRGVEEKEIEVQIGSYLKGVPLRIIRRKNKEAKNSRRIESITVPLDTSNGT